MNILNVQVGLLFSFVNYLTICSLVRPVYFYLQKFTIIIGNKSSSLNGSLTVRVGQYSKFTPAHWKDDGQRTQFISTEQSVRLKSR